MEYRNIAIIAHVDHGKTTLVDAILRATDSIRVTDQTQERLMDSGELERERGITILAKNTAVMYNGIKFNVVDTPGHADFGGEVERILSMVDGALLVVDACEGPMPQTRFVLEKALEQGLKIVLVVNKVDRPQGRPDEVAGEVLDLFCSLGADDSQLEFPVVYASAKAGVASTILDDVFSERGSLLTLLDVVAQEVPAPCGDPESPLQLAITTLDYDDYIGKIGIGRITNGRIRLGESLAVVHGPEGKPRPGKVAQLFTFGPLRREVTLEAGPGEIVAVAGMEGLEIGDTLTSALDPRPLPVLMVDEPTLTLNIRVNDSPFSGQDGRYVTSRQLRDRLWKEAKHNVALRVEETGSPDVFRISGRGELHLAILLETMRREGYEMAVSRPEVRLIQGPEGLMEPMEALTIDLPPEMLGVAMEQLGWRKGELQKMTPMGDQVRLEFQVPARGLIGFTNAFRTLAKGQGVVTHTFAGYGLHRGEIPGRNHGVLVAFESGIATAYALEMAQERGQLFISPGTQIYAGMIVGANPRDEDIEFNVCRKRHVTNMRSASAEELTRLTPPQRMGLEEAMAYIAQDELVELTPTAIRMRKLHLDREARARARKDENS